MINIFLPNVKSGFHSHKGDSFREIVKEWGERGLVNIIKTDEPYIWWGDIGDVLLYDRPTLEWWNNDSRNFNLALFGNTVPSFSEKWIFWARHPLNLEKLKIIPYEERPIESIFVGKVENNIQSNFRNPKLWEKHIELFDLVYDNQNKPYKFTNEEYLEMMGKSKFGLCLRGFGPKCHREVELMACGSIPLITPEVDIEGYYEPPVEGIHFLRVNSPEDVEKKISTISPEKWQEMSKACVEWYNRNCSVEGSFKITSEIIEKYKKNQIEIKSIATMTNINGLYDLNLLLFSLSKFQKNIPVYVACDSKIKNKLTNTYGLEVHFETVLDKYNSLNRKQMEEKGIWLDFMLEKETIIRKAMETHSNCFFLDADICILQQLPPVKNVDIMLSPHSINNNSERQFGKFNGGYFFVNNKHFLPWFRQTSYKRSHFFEQQTLDYCHEEFSVDYFPIQNNFGWWRLFECDNPQERFSKFKLNNGGICFDGLLLKSIHTHFEDKKPGFTSEFNKIILSMMQKSSRQKELYDFITNKLKPESLKINIILQTYPEKNSDRLNEIVFCILQNLENPSVEAVYNLADGNNDDYLPNIITKHKKYKLVSGYKWLTYKSAFDFANSGLADKVVCLINNDIFLDRWNISELPEKHVLALGRHEYNMKNGNGTIDQNFARLFHSNTQDAWVFKAPILVEDCDFHLGKVGCDNAIAHRLKNSGYSVFNKMEQYKIYHVDSVRQKNSTNFSEHHKKKDTETFNTHPEENGQQLVPNYDSVKNMSIDNLLNNLKYSEEERVSLISDILSHKIKIKNN